MPPQLSVVAPFYNEAENVLPLVERIVAALGDNTGGIELVLVDDCSNDGTWQAILKAREKDLRVRAVRHTVNQGQSAALWTGFKISRGAIIATLDGDLQNDPADLPRMLSELAACDMVCGVRAKRADNWMRRVSSRVARWARRLILRVDFVDSGCNLRVFRSSVLQGLPSFDGIHRFLPILARGSGARVKEIPVLHHPRAAGTSKYGLWNRLGRGIRDLVMVGLLLRRQLKVYGPGPAGTEASERVTEAEAPERSGTEVLQGAPQPGGR